jgi:protein-tyrosine phosphatase
MIDIHTHILPNVDDGARSPEESLQMIARLERDGMTHIIATPHCTSRAPLFRDEIKRRVAVLNALLQEKKSKVVVLPGSEISFFDAGDYRANYQAGRFCHLGDKPLYSLLEFPWRSEQVPNGALEHIEWILEQGTTPIIAHPERTPYLRENPTLLKEMVACGAIIQLTVDSLCGLQSAQSKIIAESILRTFEPVVLASDSHNMGRCSGLSVGYERVARKFGKARAQQLMAHSDAILQSILN